MFNPVLKGPAWNQNFTKNPTCSSFINFSLYLSFQTLLLPGSSLQRAARSSLNEHSVGKHQCFLRTYDSYFCQFCQSQILIVILRGKNFFFILHCFVLQLDHQATSKVLDWLRVSLNSSFYEVVFLTSFAF